MKVVRLFIFIAIAGFGQSVLGTCCGSNAPSTCKKSGEKDCVSSNGASGALCQNNGQCASQNCSLGYCQTVKCTSNSDCTKNNPKSLMPYCVKLDSKGQPSTCPSHSSKCICSVCPAEASALTSSPLCKASCSPGSSLESSPPGYCTAFASYNTVQNMASGNICQKKGSSSSAVSAGPSNCVVPPMGTSKACRIACSKNYSGCPSAVSDYGVSAFSSATTAGLNCTAKCTSTSLAGTGTLCGFKKLVTTAQGYNSSTEAANSPYVAAVQQIGQWPVQYYATMNHKALYKDPFPAGTMNQPSSAQNWTLSEAKKKLSGDDLTAWKCVAGGNTCNSSVDGQNCMKVYGKNPYYWKFAVDYGCQDAQNTTVMGQPSSQQNKWVNCSVPEAATYFGFCPQNQSGSDFINSVHRAAQNWTRNFNTLAAYLKNKGYLPEYGSITESEIRQFTSHPPNAFYTTTNIGNKGTGVVTPSAGGLQAVSCAMMNLTSDLTKQSCLCSQKATDLQAYNAQVACEGLKVKAAASEAQYQTSAQGLSLQQLTSSTKSPTFVAQIASSAAMGFGMLVVMVAQMIQGHGGSGDGEPGQRGRLSKAFRKSEAAKLKGIKDTEIEGGIEADPSVRVAVQNMSDGGSLDVSVNVKTGGVRGRLQTSRRVRVRVTRDEDGKFSYEKIGIDYSPRSLPEPAVREVLGSKVDNARANLKPGQSETRTITIEDGPDKGTYKVKLTKDPDGEIKVSSADENLHISPPDQGGIFEKGYSGVTAISVRVRFRIMVDRAAYKMSLNPDSNLRLKITQGGKTIEVDVKTDADGNIVDGDLDRISGEMGDNGFDPDGEITIDPVE